MNSKIFALALFAFCQVTLAQRPTAVPNPLGFGMTPPFLGAGNGFANNWIRPYYTAAAEGWRRYYEQLQQARNQLYQTLTNAQNTAQNASSTARDTVNAILSALPVRTKQANDDETHPNILGDLQAPPVEMPAQQEIHETVVTTVTRPQVQGDVQHQRPQGQATVTHLVQGQTSRQPQNNLQTVSTATRPVTSTVTSNVVPQGLPQVGGQMIPQVGNPIPNWVGK